MSDAHDPARPPRQVRSHTSLSGQPIPALVERGDVGPLDTALPGEPPYTRGVYPSMYRGRLWTMRQFAGYGTPAETNARYRFLLDQGQGGLSVAFDMPTLMGLDSDDPRSEGEVGRCGVATDSLDDFEALFDGIPLADITTSMTISGPATIAFAFFLATAERQGAPWERLGGTLQTDILKEYIAQKEWLFPPRPHLRLIGDLMNGYVSASRSTGTGGREGSVVHWCCSTARVASASHLRHRPWPRSLHARRASIGRSTRSILVA